jgi:hypothetical protein
MITGLMIAGGLVWAGSFAFSVINSRRYTNKISSDEMEASPSFNRAFNLQLWAIVGVTLGGAAFFIGLIMLIVQNLS